MHAVALHGLAREGAQSMINDAGIREDEWHNIHATDASIRDWRCDITKGGIN